MELTGPRKLPKEKIRRFLEDPETFASVVHAILLDIGGTDIYEADPVEVYLEVRDYLGIWMPVELENKWNAILTALTTDRFFASIEGFKAIATTLLDGQPDVDADEDPTFAETAWALYEVELNREDELPFHLLAEPSVAALVDRITEDEMVDIDDPAFLELSDDPIKFELVELAERLDAHLLELGINPATKNYADVKSDDGMNG